MAACTETAPLREIGLCSNPLLLCGTVCEVAFSLALAYVAPLAVVFSLTAPPPGQPAVLLAYPPLVWGVDELRKAHRRTKYR